MSIDQRIRDGLRLTSAELPQPDVAQALADVTAHARKGPQRRRLVVLLAAAAVAAVVTAAIVVPKLGSEGTPRPAGPTPTQSPRLTTPVRIDPGSLVFAADASGGADLTANIDYGRIETRPSQMDIYLALEGAAARAIVATRAHERCPAISPDRTRLAYLKDSTIVVVSLGRDGYTGSPLLQVKLPGPAVYRPRLNVGPRCPQWSPDGQRLAYLTAPGVQPTELHVVTLDGDNRVLNGSQLMAFDEPDFAWSPTGDAVAFTHSDGVWRAPLDGGAPQRLWRGGGAIGVSWSVRGELAITVRTSVQVADGEREDHTVHVVDLASGRTQRIGLVASLDARAAWSPDGSRLAFVGIGPGSTGQIWVSDRDGAALRKLVPRQDGRPLQVWDVTWSEAGHGLVAQVRADGDGLALVSLPPDGSSTTPITPWTWAFDWVNLDDVTIARP